MRRLWLAVLVGVGLISIRADDLGDAWKHYLTGDITSCLALAERAVENDEYEEDWHWLRAGSFLALGQYGEALRAATNSIERLPRTVRLRWLAREVMLQNGRTNDAPLLVLEILNLVERRPWSYRSAQDRVVVGKAALLKGADPKLVLERLFETAKQVDKKIRDPYLAIGELALEKRDFELAGKVFQEGLSELPDDPDFHFGSARAFAPSDTGRALDSAEAALKVNPHHVGSLLFLAEHQIDREDYEAAEELLGKVRAVNPYHPEAWAFQAVVAHLRNEPDQEKVARDMATKFWPTNPRVPHVIGRKLSEKYRFAQGAALQQQALEFDMNFRPAQSQLALDLLRLGEDEKGWMLAEAVHEADGYDISALNLVTLRDVLQDYRTLTNEHFRVRMEASEARIYGQRALALLEEARSVLVDKYGLEIESPVAVEIFAEQKDFAVRTFGMPESHGFLGVCFGKVITANSPASRPGVRFNWESMLWHEFCHVVTLQLTRNKMPRWLSEGISVYEERQAHSSWGERWTPAYRERVLSGRMSPVAKLSGAFLNARSPEDLQFAYFQSSLVVEFLMEQYGLENVRELLRDLGEGEWINDALEAHGAPMEELESGFETYACRQAESFGPGLDWERPPLQVLARARDGSAWESWASGRTNNVWVLLRESADLADAERWNEALPILQHLVRECPEFLGERGPWPMLAAAYRALGDREQERTVLRDWAMRESDVVDVYTRLMEIATKEENWEAVTENAERYLAVDPLVTLPYQRAAESAEAMGDASRAVEAYQVLLRMDPANPAEVHYRLAQALHAQGDPAARRHLLKSLEDAPGNRAGLQLLLELQGEEKAN
jgi:tetratricopeptide (TPR) repeat protein